MQTYQVFTSFIAVFFALAVFVLIRRDSILIGAAFRWFLIALTTLVLGLYPKLADIAASYLAISYAPILPITVVSLILLIKSLLADIQLSKLKLRQDRLTQQLSILESDIEKQKENVKDSFD